MRALICPFPAAAHVHTLISMALALRKAGHTVLTASTSSMVPYIRSAGLEAFALEPDLALPPDVPYERVEEELRASTFRGLPGWSDQLGRLADAWRPNIIVRDWAELASLTILARHDIPSVVCAATLRTDLALCDGFREVLARHGADPYGRGDLSMGDLWLSFWPPSFADPSSPKHPHEHHIRRTLKATGNDADLPDRIAQSARPLVYASFGTIFNRSPALYQSIVEAFDGLEAQLVLTTGSDRDPASLGPMPENVRAERYIPLDLLMPHCAAVVTHGGFSTVMTALSYGVPLALIPMYLEGPMIGQRCEELGVGISYVGRSGRPGVPSAVSDPDELEPGRVRQMVLSLLEEQRYSWSAQTIQAEIAALPDECDGVALIEQSCAHR